MPAAIGITHNSLPDLQGGAADEYYHLDAADYTELTAWIDDVTLSDGGDLNLGTGDLTAVDCTLSNDLLLASGSIINWNTGDITLTHAANTLTFAGMSTLDFGDADITTTGLTTTGTLTVTAPSAQPYAFSSRSTDFLTLQGQTSAKNTNFELFNKDGDNSDSTQIFLWSQGTPSSIANASALFIQNVGSAQCQIATYKAGASGIFKDLIIFTSGNANQLYLDQGTGYVGIGKAPSLGTIDINGNCSALSYSIGAVTGYNGTFTEHTGKTVTVTNGIVTSVV